MSADRLSACKNSCRGNRTVPDLALRIQLVPTQKAWNPALHFRDNAEKKRPNAFSRRIQGHGPNSLAHMALFTGFNVVPLGLPATITTFVAVSDISL